MEDISVNQKGLAWITFCLSSGCGLDWTGLYWTGRTCDYSILFRFVVIDLARLRKVR